MNPYISIIIPCYNQACFLPDVIDSIIKQTFVEWECIVVNDGSTDNTSDIAEKLAQTDTRIRVINQANIGLSGARNSGLKAANGEMLQFLDADDMLERDKLRSQVEFLRANPDIDIVFSDARYFTTENPELRRFGININKSWIPETWQAPGSLIEKFLNQNIFPVNCPLVRISVFRIVGQWNENLDAHEDWEFWLRCAANNITMAYCKSPDSLALIRMHLESMSNDKLRMKLSNVKMRIAIGNILKDPNLRIINFQKGLYQLQSINPPNITTQVIKLYRTNTSPKVLLTTVYFLWKYVLTNKLIESYKKKMPWPIQKTFLKIFGLNQI
jgi:glycosyltransferase involved in cell wall biosynthesis